MWVRHPLRSCLLVSHLRLKLQVRKLRLLYWTIQTLARFSTLFPDEDHLARLRQNLTHRRGVLGTSPHLVCFQNSRACLCGHVEIFHAESKQRFPLESSLGIPFLSLSAHNYPPPAWPQSFARSSRRDNHRQMGGAELQRTRCFFRDTKFLLFPPRGRQASLTYWPFSSVL